MTIKCVNCGESLGLKDVWEVIPPVLEDPVKILVFKCRNCGTLTEKDYEM